MTQAYSNPDRESEPNALPDIEVFYLSEQEAKDRGLTDGWLDGDGEPMGQGFYWHSCFPGCLPDSDPVGPFKTQAEALADAQSGND